MLWVLPSGASMEEHPLLLLLWTPIVALAPAPSGARTVARPLTLLCPLLMRNILHAS